VADRPTLDETIALLEATLDAAHDAILVVDLNRRVIHFNRRYLTMFGFTADDLGRGGMDLVMERLLDQLEDPDELRARSHELWADPSTERLDVLRFKDGRIVEQYVAPHQIGSRIVGRVESFRDIGSSVRAFEAVKEQCTFLEQVQEVAHVGSWVARTDEAGRLGWSAETHRIFGVPIGAFEGTSEAFWAFVHPDDRDTVRAAGAAALAGDRPFDFEHRIIRADGAVRWLQERAHIVRDAQGQAVRMIGTVQDITERRQLEDQLRQSQKMEAIGRLAGGIAHDLNNALTAIAGYAELALGELESGHAARGDVEEIRRAAERAGSVTRQLLAFSRKQLLEPRVFDLNETVAAIARMLSRLLGPEVRVQTRLADAVLPVLGDPGQIEQTLINLAVNARDAMPSGGQLIVSTARETVDDDRARSYVPMSPGEYVVVRVADTGHGMSGDTKARIFEPFFTTKDVGKGTGLGLSMVYGTLKQCGGFIFVDSEVDRGTTFHLYFPAVAAATPAPHAASAAQDKERRGHETLLIVEDEPSVRNLVASSLRQEGFHLLLAASAEEALSIVDTFEGPIDLLLTDAIMPGKSGIELAAFMTTRSPGLRIIIMSGYTEETLSIPGGNGAVNLLHKPFTPRQLRQRIRDALER
jgi:PAS domain S-box-containing protein